MFCYRSDVAGAHAAFTDARAASSSEASGGDAASPYGGLNLGGHVGDEAQRVLANRAAVAAELGVAASSLVFMDQCHGSDVAVVDAADDELGAVDGIVTANPELTLAVLVADCVPVLLSDPEAGLVAAVHAGRPGMVAGIVARALGVMRDLGSRSPSAIVGPSVCGRCYEVPEQMRDDASAASAVSPTVSWTGTPAIDVAAGVVDQLKRGGAQVTWVPGCTRERADLYSYRRDGVTGRFAGLIRRG